MTDTAITEKSKKPTKTSKQPEERKNTKSFKKKQRMINVQTLRRLSVDDNESEEDVKDSDREETKTTQVIEEYIDYTLKKKRHHRRSKKKKDVPVSVIIGTTNEFDESIIEKSSYKPEKDKEEAKLAEVDKHTEEKNNEEKPIEEKPIEEKPIEEKPIEEKHIEEKQLEEIPEETGKKKGGKKKRGKKQKETKKETEEPIAKETTKPVEETNEKVAASKKPEEKKEHKGKSKKRGKGKEEKNEEEKRPTPGVPKVDEELNEFSIPKRRQAPAPEDDKLIVEEVDYLPPPKDELIIMRPKPRNLPAPLNDPSIQTQEKELSKPEIAQDKSHKPKTEQNSEKVPEYKVNIVLEEIGRAHV